ncbi:MAG: hypothetical protein CM15mV11_0460 [Caudoviricetes sp.]|nr:MAG: hypothetical protein CM15mV11_0460 [Caudoviricetes sp.]
MTEPLSVLQDRSFEDIIPTGAPDGIPDLSNANTTYANQISLDGGIYNSLYGIEETQGGTNTTLFQVGDNIKDGIYHLSLQQLPLQVDYLRVLSILH